MLTKKQFDTLTLAKREGRRLSQRTIAAACGFSLGTVNSLLTELTALGYLEGGIITEKGVMALEPYRVKRAVILAAGFGERLVPITLNTPKPLVRVKGARLIDSLLDALTAAGIPEIYIVRGYLSEQFDQLLYKYPGIKFIENPAYNETNNISSAMCARYLFAGAYICEADLLINNPSLITEYQYQTNYLGVAEKETDDWCFSSKNGIITGLSIGGRDCHRMVGISYFDERDGAKLAGHIESVYTAPGGKERFWDTVPLVYYPREYKIAIRECSADDVKEIDTYRELKVIDPTYV